MITKAEHVFEYADCLSEILFFVCTSLQYVRANHKTMSTGKTYPREGFDQPEGT
jgi:hypothetical protein